MKYIQCPSNYQEEEKSIFLAGGISNCPLWQDELVDLLKDSNLAVINPRRKSYNQNEPGLEEEQITWEFKHLKKVSAVSFWFPKETLCPITLYELGKESTTEKPIFIGIHPDYARKNDIEIQTKLLRPDVKIVNSIKDLVKQIKNWEKNI